MKKRILLPLFAIIWVTIPMFGQATKPKQRRTTPYVYKTDYEAKMKDIDTKVNGAYGTANALKRELSGKLDKVDELDSKMQEVEEILSSANFKIGLTSDSLNKTRFSMREFKATTENEIAGLKDNAEQQQKLIWMAMGLATVLSILVLLIISRVIRKVRITEEQNAELLRNKFSSDLEEQKKSITSELMQTKTRLANDTNRVRDEAAASSEAISKQLNTIIQRLDAIDKT